MDHHLTSSLVLPVPLTAWEQPGRVAQVSHGDLFRLWAGSHEGGADDDPMHQPALRILQTVGVLAPAVAGKMPEAHRVKFPSG